MKLKPLRKKGTPADLPTQDQHRMQTIRVRLNQVSESIRQRELAAEREKRAKEAKAARQREPEPLAPPSVLPSNKLRVKVTRKGVSQNLTLKSPSQLAPSSSANELVWKARRMHGRHLPVLQCNNCSISRVCPKFKAGYECAFLPYLNSHKVETADDLVKYMKLMVGASMKRAQLMNIIETANGGMPSVETSEALDMAFRQLKDLNEVMTQSGEESVEIEGDATIVGSIFGGMKLEQVIKETAEMKRVDPVLSLPEVPLAVDDVRALPSQDVSAELVRDALLGASGSPLMKKDLQVPAIATIQQTDIQKSP